MEKQENVQENKKDEKEQEKRDCNFIYFIDTHEKTKKFKIYLPEEYEGKDSLEKIKEKEIKKDTNDLSSLVYRFKIIPGSLKKEEGENYELLISADDEEGKKQQYSIKFNDEEKERDFYEYDFNIEEIDNHPLTHEEQFEIYVEILRKTYNKKVNSPENDDLIISTHRLLDEEGKKYNFFFYLLIFLECYRTKYIQQHLLKFKPEKIEGLGTFPEAKLKQLKTILNLLSKNPKSLNLHNSKDEAELMELFYSILLYFNMNFQKEKVEEMFKDDKISKYLIKKLNTFRDLYKELNLEKETIINLMKKSETFDDILGLLQYIRTTDTIEFLKFINEQKEIINDIYGKELDKLNEENEKLDKEHKKEMKKLDIEKYVIPKKDDKIMDIFTEASLIFNFEKMNNIHMIYFSKSLLGKYLDFYFGKSLDGLQLINKLIELIKKNDKKFEFKYNDKDMNQVIHDTGIELINRGEMKNNAILDFITSDIYYNSEQFNKSYYRTPDVLNGIDINTLDDKFFVTWLTMNFNKIFGYNLNLFYEKITGFIKEMKDFGLLFKFFLYNNEKEYKTDVLKIMKKKYIELFPTLNDEKYPNYENDTIKLISLIDSKKLETKDLLEFLQNNLDFEKVNDLYLKLTEQNKNLHDKTKDAIIAYFTTEKNNTNPSRLIFLIKNCKNYRKEMFSRINKYIITENDFISVDETENYKLYKGLIDNKIIDKDFAYKGATYITKVQTTISSLENKIKNFELKYKDIIIFFRNEKMKNILKEKLLYLNMLDEKTTEQNMNNLDTKIKEIKNKIDDFEIIFSDFRDFFYQKHSADLKKLTEICFNLKNENLNYFEKNYVEEYKNYSQYLEEAKKRGNLKRSTFFNEILKNNQKTLYKNDEEKALEETIKTFNGIKIIFEDNGITKIDEKILEICVQPFKGRSDSLKSELNILGDIFKVNVELDKIFEGILLFSKRVFIFETATSIINFIEKINPKMETDFSKNIKEIINLIQNNKDIETIKKCNQILIDLKIFDGNERENKLINILSKFKEQPESIRFLLETNNQELSNLQEIATLNESNIVNANDILDMEKCIEFFKDIGTLKEIEKMTDNDIISKMDNKVKEKKDIYVYFEKYVNNYNQIKLLKASVNKSEFLKYKIDAIFGGSEFLLSNKKDDLSNNNELLFKCFYETEIQNKKEKDILSRSDIISLRDRALLSKTITPEYKYFIDSISEIINISNILKEMYIKGYPKIINIKLIYKVDINKDKEEVQINPQIKYFVDEQATNSFKEIISYLKNILKDLKQKQIDGYINIPLIRYLYGRQFNLLYDNFDKKENNQIEPLLKYITNDCYKKSVNEFKINKEGDLIKNNIQDWHNYLSEILKINGLTQEKIYEPTFIDPTKLKKNTGMFTYVCDKPEKNIFQIYKYITGQNPIAQNILLCTKMTSNEEITAFLYRAILCEYNSCFIVAGLESLETEKKSTILDILNNFFQRENKQKKSCLIFLYSNKNSDIYKSLEMKHYRQILEVKDDQFKDIKYTKNDIEIIQSDKSGVGKSTQIKLDIERNKKKRIYFPFGGAFSQEDIISRLKKLKIDDNCVLHLDLYDSDQTNLMMEVLFSLLITRFFGQNEDIFFLSKNIPIKVEIPNTFINFFEKFPVLNLFNTRTLKISELAPLIVPKNITCNIEVVANYLKALKDNKINQYDFIFPKITPVDFEKRKYQIKNLKGKTSSLKPEEISEVICQKLIFDIIKSKIKEPNYYQIISFINVLAVQLKKFNQNFYLSAYEFINNGRSGLCPIRTFVVESFIKLTSHFTEGAFSELLKSQDKARKAQYGGEYDENKDLNNAINKLAIDVKDVISFDKIDPSLLFFHEKDSQLFSIITNKQKTDKEYIDLLRLKNSQFDVGQKGYTELPNYKNYKKKDFLQEIANILNITTPISKGEVKGRKSLEEIVGNYAITPDNFVKMVLILIRIRSRIPVIMMGETGCGKTSLIRMLSEMKNDGDKTKLKILNIHAGTNDDDIINFINDTVIPSANDILESEKEKKAAYERENQIFEYTKLWVFLDEINTCKSMGLISELMCKHTCQGNPLPENIVFIAACNPYRTREIKKGEKEEQIGLDINQAHNQMKQLNQKEIENIQAKKGSNLVYTVNPLPHSLLNFVFYFGQLKPEDEQKYIGCIISQVIDKIYYDERHAQDKKKGDAGMGILKELACDLIWAAQQYIRSKNDKSAVSLREIRRVNIFCEFFYNYLYTKKDFYTKGNQNELQFEEDAEFYKNLDDYSIQVYAINLSIFMCYYLRITSKEQRKELEKIMNDILSKYKIIKLKDFLDLPRKEERFIVNNIKLGKGIAKNRALLENIFSLFVAINSKVPIFIVGKPGCSKSLSMQLIAKSMQGTASDKPFFKKLPRVMIHSYQGSLSSTSKGVENVFIKARETLSQINAKDKNSIISLIYFDEMGLAEHSPHNPLKVIHAELEYDHNENDKQVAFVGISNWNLDAAKMNRGISISIPEPDEEDNKETAFTIGNSYDEVMARNYKNFFENLGKSYYNYKQYLKQKHSNDGKEDFHGNRDFYHLVKNSARNMIDKQNEKALNDASLLECAIDSIERNFSGIQFEENNKKASLEIFKEIFHEIYPDCQIKKEYDVLKRVKENINDINSRYLLIASESSIGTFLLSSILEGEKKDYSFYIGSPFEQDLNSEEYALKVLNKIQAHMEQGNILILKNLESVYPSMYDLFNQNFTVISNKNYSRLAVGSNTNTFAYVDKDFRCIVNVEKAKLDQEEAPFLNRFEKHIMSFEYMMDNELIREAEKIKTTIDGFFKCNDKIFKAINYDLKKLMINCGKEEIQALVYKANKSGIKKENINDYVLEIISNTLPQDILINLKISGAKQAKNLKKILNYYNKGEHSNFCKFLEKTQSQKNIVYTFTGYLEDVMDEGDIVKNKLVGEIKKENIQIIQLNSIKSEREFEIQLDDYLNEENRKVCIIKFLPYEGTFMNYIKYFIENKINDNKKFEKKLFIFMVYMSRISLKEISEIDKKTLKEKEEFNQKILTETLSNLSGYYQIFIDNLSGDPKYKIDKILNMKRTELFTTLINPDKELTSNIFTSISYMQYNVVAPYKGLSRDNYVDKLIEFISNNRRLRDLMNQTILNQSFKGDADIITKIFKEKNSVTSEDIELTSVIKRYLSKIYTSQLSLMYFKAEKDQFFSSILSNNLEQPIWPKKRDNNKDNNDEEEEIKPKKEIYIDETIIERISKHYLENMVYNDGKTTIVEKIGANKVDIIFGLKIPGIKPIIDRIIISVKENILVNYQKNENELRNYLDPEEIEEAQKKYFNDLSMLNNSLSVLINKEESLKNIINLFINREEEEKEIYNLLLLDYYSLFLNSHINKSKNKKENEEEDPNNFLLMIDNFDNNIKYLNLMIVMRENTINAFFGDKNLPNNSNYHIASIINFIECYSEEITSLHQIFLKLSLKIPELFEQIEEIISSGQIVYEISERNPEYTAIVNKVFFLCLDAILRIITSKPDIYELPLDDFFDLINTNKEILQNAFQLEAVLKLRSKEAFSLQEILKIINALYLNNIANVKNVKQIIQYFKEETDILQKEPKNKLCLILDKFYNILEKMMGKLPPKKDFDFYKLLSMILLDEFNKIQFPRFRELILDKILKKNDLIKNSSQVIKIIIENAGIESYPSTIENNIDYIRGEDSSMFKTLNNTKNAFLEEVIMNIFERKIIKYFELIPTLDEKQLKDSYKKYFEIRKGKSKAWIIFDKSFTIFQDTIKILDSISKFKISNKENTNLLKLYSIVYVKIYLYYMTDFLINNPEDMKNIRGIIDCINNISNKELSKVIKIYILKLIFNLKNNDFEEFKAYDFAKNGISFYKEIEGDKKAGDIMLTYFFLPSEPKDYEKYNQVLDAFIKNGNFNIENRDLETQLDKNGLDIFLQFAINKIISNLPLANFESKDIYKNFSKYAKTLFDPNKKKQFSFELCQLLFLFFDFDIYKARTKTKISKDRGKVDLQVFEALLYGFRLCVNTLYFEKGKKNDIDQLLFPSMLSKGCQKAIESSLIPGNDNKEDLRITTLDAINIHFSTFPDPCGCYVCSCGFYYNIDPCGFPTTNRTNNCPICGQKYGWGPKVIKDQGATNHGMVIRPGHYRIFKDQAQKNSQMNRWHDPDDNIPNRILDDYIRDVIDPIRKKSGYGFNVIDRDFFEKQDKKIRKLTNIAYRLLNYVSYCHLFYSFCLGNMTNLQLNKYLIKNCDILKIIQIDWSLLKEALQQKNVDSIQIFLNIIFPELIKLLKEYKITKNEKDREQFESKVEDLINIALKKYPDYSIKYKEENQKQSDTDIRSLKTYVTELIHPSSESYTEKEYPMFKYFNYTKYKSEADMLKRMHNKEKYALILQLISDSPDVKKLKYLPAFNEFTNYMVNYYSFKISREDAKKNPLDEEEITKEQGFNKKYNNFINAWDHIKTKAIKYKCRPEMQVKQGFSKKDKLINFLNDAGELLNGMYLASACQNFIEWQNTFLQPIVDSNAFNGILHNYVNNISKKIPVQEAKLDQVVLIEERFEKYRKYIDFNDVIYAYSERNIFGENGKINYSDYNTFVYDYDSMEEELGKIILPGVCLFEGEDNLNFVTYWGEGFRGGNSSMISKFYGKYKQIDLDVDEKKIVFNYISNMNKNKSNKANQRRKYDFKYFFGSMQILLFYLTEKGVMSESEKIINIIKEAPGYLKLSNDCKSFFYNEGRNFTLNKVMNLFFFFEHLCFEDLADTLQLEYQQKIPEETKNKIIEKLVKQNNPNDTINAKNLGAATRRLISRYLAGKLEVTDIKEDRDLSFELSREELWEEKIGKLEDLMDLIMDKVNEFKLTVGQAYDFYNIIGDDDRNTLNINNQK